MKKGIIFSMVFLACIAACIATLLTFRESPFVIQALDFFRPQSTPGSPFEYIEVPSVIVSFPDRSGRFCKAGFTLSVRRSESGRLRMQHYQQFSQAAVAEIMTGYSIERLMTYPGKMQLKEHIKAVLNRNMESVPIDAVYIREIVFQ